MFKLRKNKKGFSLVELIVVIAIMAVLAGVVGGAIFGQLNKQKNNTASTQVITMAGSLKDIIQVKTSLSDEALSEATLEEIVAEFLENSGYEDVLVKVDAVANVNDTYKATDKYALVVDGENNKFSILYKTVGSGSKTAGKVVTYVAPTADADGKVTITEYSA